MAWTYILACADGSYYVGSTIDLERRVWQHNEGTGATYTRRRRPVRLVWAAAFHRVDQAYAYEKRLQGWGRVKRQALIEGRGDLLPELASRSWNSDQLRAQNAEHGGFDELVVREPEPQADDRAVRSSPPPAAAPVIDENDPWARRSE